MAFGVVSPAAPPVAPTPPPAPLPPPPVLGGLLAPPVAPAPAPAPAPVQVHKQSGLPVGAVYRKYYNHAYHTVTVTPNGFQLSHANGTTSMHGSLTAAATAVRGKLSTDGWAFFKVAKPPKAAPAVAPTPAPSAAAMQKLAASNLHSTIPFAPETSWESGKSGGAGIVLNGVPFASAPAGEFWKHTADVPLNEPKPLRPIERVLCIIKEPDGRVWIVEPTNHYGNRKNTIPGGGVERGLSNQQNAIKEAFEETGLHIKITGYLGDNTDSNTKRNGRVYLAERIGGAPWDAKPEPGITNQRTGQKNAPESDHVRLCTPEHAAKLLNRTDDQAMLTLASPMDVKTKADGEMLKKVVEGLKPTADAYVAKAKGKAGSPVLHAVQELRGFNEKPTVVAKKDFNALMAKGEHIEMLRGLQDHGGTKATDMCEQFKTGTHFPGFGCFGDGTYADASKSNGSNGNVATSNYGRGGDIVRIALPKTAKIIKQSELEKIIGTQSGSYGSKTGLHPDNFTATGGGHGSARSWAGIHAALAGYDAIHVDGNSSMQGNYGNRSKKADEGFYVILNRSVLTVQKESAKGHVLS
jgi:ADP-ribose pyrophosphatase YjhB (NUDIX family)